MIAIGIAVALLSAKVHSGKTRLTQIPATIGLKTGTLPPAPAHVVIIVEENKQFSDITGNARSAPYLNALMKRAAVFTQSYGVAHPSQPNYLALFAGVTDTNGDGCPPAGINPLAPNLASELASAHRTFAGYAEDLPAIGSRACWSGQYARKHVPWADFFNVPSAQIAPFTALPKFDALPTVSFIIPNLLNDMHSASIARGDRWLRERVGTLIAWADTHDSLVIVTWDESDTSIGNHIPTLFYGPMVRAGTYSQTVTHYRVLRTIEDFYRLGHAGASAGVPPITDVWR